jgi:predicted metal-dependent HD superfamily phosphohydrolase
LEIAHYEHVIDSKSLLLLETAAWLHDTGFTLSYSNHEYYSCKIAKEMLPGLGANSKEIDAICSLIMGTKIPQTPPNTLGTILCDADLDYLGTGNFTNQSEALKNEWLHFGILESEAAFNNLQIPFLEHHKYFTQSSQARREPIKMDHLNALRTQPNGHSYVESRKII